MLKAILTLFILTLHTISHAQASPPVLNCQNIIGTLRNLDTDEVIPNAKIALEHKGEIVAEAVSDNYGNYTFNNMEHGLYSIKATLYDYDYAYIDQVEINTCKTKYVDLDFDLGSIATLEPVNVEAKKVKHTVLRIVCGTTVRAKKISTTTSNKEFDEEFANELSQEVSSRTLPGPSNKNPQKPIKELNIYPNPSFGQLHIELTFETLP